ncbi:MAG: hypothetical protein Q9191_008544, partial [Dirinaria sp. TL-2023a]
MRTMTLLSARLWLGLISAYSFFALCEDVLRSGSAVRPPLALLFGSRPPPARGVGRPPRFV